MKKVLSLIILITLVFGAFGVTNTQASTSSAYNAVKKIYKKYCPKAKNIQKKDMFGRYSKILGVLSVKGLKSYKVGQAFEGKSKKVERVVVIVQVKKKSQIKGIKNKFRSYVNTRKGAAKRGYFSKYGKKVLNNASIGSKGKYVYLLMLDASGNKKAKAAVKKAA